MKHKILALAILVVLSIAAVLVGKSTGNQGLLTTGVIVCGFIAIGFAVWLFKVLATFIGQSLASIVYVVALLIVVGFLAGNQVINSVVSFASGSVLGGILSWLVIRKFGKMAEKSIVAGEIFSFVSNYGIKHFIDRNSLVEKDAKIGNTEDYKNIILILSSEMGFKKIEAKEAATYALAQTTPNDPLETKLETALKYLGQGKQN